MSKFFLIASMLVLQCGALLGKIESIVVNNNTTYPIELEYTPEGSKSAVKLIVRPNAQKILPYGIIKHEIRFWTAGEYRSKIAATYTLNSDIASALPKMDTRDKTVIVDVYVDPGYVSSPWKVRIHTSRTEFAFLPDQLSLDEISANPTLLFYTGESTKNTQYFLKLPADSSDWRFIVSYEKSAYEKLKDGTVDQLMQKAQDFEKHCATVIVQLDRLKANPDIDKAAKSLINQLKDKIVHVKEYKFFEHFLGLSEKSNDWHYLFGYTQKDYEKLGQRDIPQLVENYSQLQKRLTALAGDMSNSGKKSIDALKKTMKTVLDAKLKKIGPGKPSSAS